MNRKKIRIAYTDISLGLAECILSFVKDEYDFELTQSRDADFVIHSVGGMDVTRYPGVRIFVTGENVTPNFGISDYAMAFDKLNFGDRYLWLPLSRYSEERHQILLRDRPDPTTELANKHEFCAYVMSNTTGSNDARVRIYDLLSEYKTVRSGGKWRNNVGGRVPNKLAFQKEHKFAIAFENCTYPGYLTEKFIDAVEANVVPIYWGDPDIAEYFNPKAFINCHDYDTLEEVIEKVREIDNDDERYMQMLGEPWFKDGVEPECFHRAKIVGFLTHIFSQPVEQAYRRNRGRWGVKYEKALFDMHFRPHVQVYKRIRTLWRKFYPQLFPWLKRR